MKAPRYAHWLLVPTLALGMALGPVQAHAAPEKPTGEAEAAPKGEGGEAPKAETVPKGKAAKGKAGEAPKGKAAKGKAGEAPKGKTEAKAGGAPKVETGDAEDDAAEAPEDAAEAAPDAGAGASPDEAAPEAGTTPAPEADAPASADAEPPAAELPLEPAVTVQPRPVEPALETSTVSGGTASREAVADPRRLRSDDRILFRAGILSLGVAAAAVVPTVIGFQQAYVAHQDDDPARERTMRGLGIGAGVAAGTYAITGVVLVALGARQRRAVVAPAVGAGQLGAVLRARF